MAGLLLIAFALGAAGYTVAQPAALAFVPDGGRDRTAEVLQAVDAVRTAGGGEIRFAKGVYHFRSPAAMRFYVSNHDNPMPRNVFLPVTNVADLVFAAESAEFVFHGEGIGFMLMDTQRVKVRGIGVDCDRPFFSEARFLRYENGRPVFRADPARFPFAIEKNALVAVGEGWKEPERLTGLFSGSTHEFLGSVWFDGRASALGDGVYRIETDWSKVSLARPLMEGDTVLLRSAYRPNPAVFFCRAHDTLWEDCAVHSSAGMGVIAQRCRNVTLRGSGSPLDRRAGSFARAETGRMTSLQADATHFSNCAGRIVVENCLFEGMVDDAINVHSTCLRIEKVLGADRMLCRYMHAQSVGFEVFLPGETLRYIRARTFENVPRTVKVLSAEMRSHDRVELRTAEPIPSGVGEGDAVENADWQPSVDFRCNTVRCSAPRATLFTTPGRVRCEGNLFDHVAGQPVHLSADAWDWYESGACRDVTIRNNVFRDCMLRSGKGMIQIWPNVKDIASQRERYHRNILVEGNVFDQFRVPLVYARSVSNLVWRANRVTWNTHYPARDSDGVFHVEHSEGVFIEDGKDGLK